MTPMTLVVELPLGRWFGPRSIERLERRLGLS